VNKNYMAKHLQTVKHELQMISRENMEVAEAWKYKPPRN
jgi:hypothetical protein